MGDLFPHVLDQTTKDGAAAIGEFMDGGSGLIGIEFQRLGEEQALGVGELDGVKGRHGSHRSNANASQNVIAERLNL